MCKREGPIGSEISRIGSDRAARFAHDGVRRLLISLTLTASTACCASSGWRPTATDAAVTRPGTGMSTSAPIDLRVAARWARIWWTRSLDQRVGAVRGWSTDELEAALARAVPSPGDLSCRRATSLQAYAAASPGGAVVAVTALCERGTALVPVALTFWLVVRDGRTLVAAVA
jgi:hypothetical protein